MAQWGSKIDLIGRIAVDNVLLKTVINAVIILIFFLDRFRKDLDLFLFCGPSSLLACRHPGVSDQKYAQDERKFVLKTTSASLEFTPYRKKVRVPAALMQTPFYQTRRLFISI